MPSSSVEARASSSIAVVIPVYNRCKLIKKTLETVVGQTQLPQTLAVADDGSTDGTAEVAEQWLSSAAPPFEWKVIRAPHQNAAAARNHGMSALGEESFVAFLDSDDLWPDDFLDRTLGVLKENPDAIAVTSDRIQHYSNRTSKVLSTAGLQEDAISWIFMNDAGIASCSLFRTDAVRRAGGWDEELDAGEDFSLFMEVAKKGKWLHLPGEAVIFNRRSENTSGQEINLSRSRPSMKRDWAILHEQAFSQFPFNSPHRCGALRNAVSTKWQWAGAAFRKQGQLKKAIDAYRAALSWDYWSLEVRIRLWQSWMLAWVTGELRSQQVETRQIARIPKIEKIYFINLDKDKARRQLIEERISSSFPGIPCERIPGVPVGSLPQYEQFFSDRLEERFHKEGTSYPRPGTIGCFLAHRNALQEANRFHIENSKNGQSDGGAILILEDDCELDQSVLPAMESIMRSYLPGDWNAIKHSLGDSNICDRINKGFNDVSGSRYRRWTYYWGAHFVLYRAAALNEVLQQMESEKIYDYDAWLRDQIDHVYSFAQRLNIKQSRMGGSNTNPAYMLEDQADPNSKYSLANMRRVLQRYLDHRQSKP